MIKFNEFIKRAKEVHGDKYDYSLVEYKKITDKVRIICPIHGEFIMEARAHYRGQGCPKCGNIKKGLSHRYTTEKFINKAREIHGDKYDYSKVQYSIGKENVTIWCPIHGDFEMSPHSHLAGRGCPKCGNLKKGSIQRLTQEEFIEKAKKIHGDEYDYSLVEYKNNNTKIKIICRKHGVFETLPYVHLAGHKCPKCFNETTSKRQLKNTEWFINKAKEAHGNKYEYLKTTYKNIHSPVTITCKKHGDFTQIATYHLNGCGCPKCGVTISKNENELFDFVKQYFNDAEQSNRTTIPPYEIDIYIPSLKIGIEYNGILWHSTKYKTDKNYHLNKLKLANDSGIKLIQIFEDEFVNNKELVFNKIRHILGVGNTLKRIPGRKCEIQEIQNETANEFLSKNHLQGYALSTKHLGAYFNNELVGVMSFKQEKRGSDKWELTRFASNCDYICQGVGGKLLKYFIKNYNPSYIKSFADRRWTINENNNLYTKLGFTFDGYVGPDYKYFNHSEGIKRQHKFGFRKQRLHKLYGLPLTMTETEMTEQLGYVKIYDCGLIRYIWVKRY